MAAFGLTAAIAMPAFADDWEVGAGGNAARNGTTAEVGPASPTLLWSGSRSAIVAQQAVVGAG
ncbi:MAG: hypothetical protein ACOC0P_06730, partial [Planctomycetota bacterium]